MLNTNSSLMKLQRAKLKALLMVCSLLFINAANVGAKDSRCNYKGLYQDVPIAKVEGTDLSINIAFPKKCQTQPRPVVILIHGGGFISGDKRSNNERILKLTKLGFVAASAMYRLAPTHRFPMQLEDIKLAIRFLKANAHAYYIDPERIIVSGSSAGGYLAVMAGVAGNSNIFSNHGLYLHVDSSVRAVAAQSAPIGNFSLPKYADRQTVKRLLDTAAPDRKAALAAMSAITFLDESDPSMFLSHGDADPIVPIEMSREFVHELKSIGHDFEYHEIAGGTHSFSESAPTQSTQTFSAYIQFLKRWAN